MVTVLPQDMYLGRRAQQNEAAAKRAAAAAARTSGQQGGGGGAKPADSARDSPEATSVEELAAERHAPPEGRAAGNVNHGKVAAQHSGAAAAGATEAEAGGGGGGGDAEVADGVASAAAGARRNSSPVQHLRSSLREERQAADDDNPRCAIFGFPEIKDLRAALGVKSGRRPRTTGPAVCFGCCGVWGSQWTLCCSTLA